MANQVSLQDVMSVLGGPLGERSLWALLNQAHEVLVKTIEDYEEKDPRLLIIPESMLLSHGGSVQFLVGISPSDSSFTAPELCAGQKIIDFEKCYVYSLGMSLFAAMRNGMEEEMISQVSHQLQTLFVQMTDDNCDQRATLKTIDEQCCINIQSKSDAKEEIYKLVSCVLGTSIESSSNFGDDEKIDESNLEAEFQQVMNMGDTSGFNHLYAPSCGSSPLSLRSISNEYARGIPVKASNLNNHESMYCSLPLVFQSDANTSTKQWQYSISSTYGPFDVVHHYPEAMMSKTLPKLNYASHYYTPSRRRKPTEAKKIVSKCLIDEERIRYSMPLYRSSSDGHKDSAPIKPGEAMNLFINTHNLKISDMPPLPPKSPDNVTKEMSLESGASLQDEHSQKDIILAQSTSISSCYNVSNHSMTGDEREFDFPSPPLPPQAQDDPPSTVTVEEETVDVVANEDEFVFPSPNPNPQAQDDPPSTVTEEETVDMVTNEDRFVFPSPNPNPQAQDDPPSTVTVEEETVDVVANEEYHHIPYDKSDPEHVISLSDDDVAKPSDAVQREYKVNGEDESIISNDKSMNKHYSSDCSDDQTSETLHEVTQIRAKDSATSLKKLSAIFGPEFNTMTGIQGGKKVVVNVPTDRRIVEVVMLNGRAVQLIVERTSSCRELFTQVIAHQSLEETHIFGLAILEEFQDHDEIFLEFDRKLVKYAPKGWDSNTLESSEKFTVFFRVQYYVENVNQLRLSQTRHLYYLQLRKDIMEAKTYCHDQSALKLAAYALQAEKRDDLQHYRLEDYLHLKVIDKIGESTIRSILPQIHSELNGQNRELAELHFLKEAQTLPEYGMIFYKVANKKNGKIGSMWLGLSVRGIVIYNVHRDIKTPTSYWPWKNIKNLSFSNKKFVIEVEGPSILKVYTDSYRKARYLLHLSIHYHRFQLLPRGPLEGDNFIHGYKTHIDDNTSFQGQGTKHQQVKAHDISSDEDIENSRMIPQGKELSIDIEKKGGIIGLHLSGGRNKTYGYGYIYVKSINKGSIAAIDERIKENDIVLEVNKKKVEGMTHKEAASLILNVPNMVSMHIHRPNNSQWLKESINHHERIKGIVRDESWSMTDES